MTDKASNPPVEVDGLSKTFRVGFWRRRIEAVRDVSFKVDRGEIFGLVGPNGAGKTTTMKMMTGLVYPDEGRARLFGQRSTEVGGRRHLGYLPEEPYFYEHLTARELVHYYGALHGMRRNAVEDRMERLLELVGLSEARERPIRNFSKGMRQRAGIAQALVNDPDVVILDEPQSGLDPVGRREVRDLIVELREEGKTVLFSSHILVDVEAVCDRVAILNDGELVTVADLDELAAPENEIVEVEFDGVDSETVSKLDGVLEVQKSGRRRVASWPGTVDIRDAVVKLDDLGADIVRIDRRSRRLEEHFLEETGADLQPTSDLS